MIFLIWAIAAITLIPVTLLTLFKLERGNYEDSM